jgi:hypothetical protein
MSGFLLSDQTGERQVLAVCRPPHLFCGRAQQAFAAIC